MLKVSWKDKVKNTEVLSRMAEKETRFYKNIARQKNKKWLMRDMFLEVVVGLMHC